MSAVRRTLCTLMLLGAPSLTGCVRRIPQAYAGQWVLRSSDSYLMSLHTEVHGSRMQGELLQPKLFTEAPDGSFLGVTQPMTTRPLAGRQHGKSIRIQIGLPGQEDASSMVLRGPDRLELDFFHGAVPAWTFERVNPGDHPVVKVDWPEADSDPHVVVLRSRLSAAADADRSARQREPLDDVEIARLAAEALPLLTEIYETYGWPAASQFGPNAASDFWLLVQHQELATQKNMLGSLRLAASAGEAVKSEYAYLFDRVRVAEGKSQHWGTQSRCEHRHAVLYPLDASIDEVNERRRQIGLAELSGKESERLCQQAATQ